MVDKFKPRRCPVRVHVGDLANTKVSGLVSTLYYEQARKTSQGNARFMQSLVQQLHVPVEDAKATAEKLLDANLVCTLGGEYEIVVADDASTDTTAALANQAGARVVHVENRQISKTRNAGARAALGDRLIFVDADTVVNAEVIRSANWALDHGAVGGGATPVFDSQAPRWGPPMIRAVVVFMRWFRLAAGCFVFVRRDAFDAVGGFDERHFAGEEVMLSWALRRHGRDRTSGVAVWFCEGSGRCVCKIALAPIATS